MFCYSASLCHKVMTSYFRCNSGVFMCVREEHKEVCDLFLRAAQLSPETLDSDIQARQLGKTGLCV